MFDAGDDILDGAEVLVHRLSEEIPMHVMLIDLGGGLATGKHGFRIGINDVLSAPFQAFWKGVMTPGLRWSAPPPAPNMSGLLSRAMLDGRSGRPVGQQNYALITRDYLNLNARLDYHFTMVDTVCGRNPRENYVRFRFKGGGTNIVHRERRTQFIAKILKAHDFVIDLRGDLLTASLIEMHSEEIEGKLIMIGRLTGFTRLLDATMTDDDMPAKVARAFLDGDYGLEGLET